MPARTVTLKLTYYDMKSITQSLSREATNKAYEIFMTAFGLLDRLKHTQAADFRGIRQNMRTVNIPPIRLIGISLQNLSFSGSRQLTFDDVYGIREESLAKRWANALVQLERKYEMKIATDRRVDLYEAIESMETYKNLSGVCKIEQGKNL